MAESFMGAYRLAQLQAGTQIQTARMQQETAAAEAQAKQFQEMAKNAQSNIDAALKTVSTMAQSHLDKGGDIADPQFQAAAGVIVDSALQTSAQYASKGLPVVAPDILAAQFQNVFNAPSRVQAAQAEGTAEAAKTAITEPAKQKATIETQNAMELVDAFDTTTGKATQATREQMKTSQGKIIPLSARDQPYNADLKTVVDTTTGDVKSAQWDPRARRLTDLDGNPLGANWVPTTVQGTPDEIGVTTASRSRIEEQVGTLNDSLAIAETALKQFNASYLTWPTQVKDKALGVIEKMGAELGPEQQKFKGDITRFKQNAITGLNLGIKAVTGASMSVGEIERLRAQFPDPENDSPTAFKAKLQQSIVQMRLARARAIWMAKNGITYDWKKGEGEPPVDLDQFKVIMERRAEEIKTVIRQERPDLKESDLDTEAARALAKEFGG